jgi:hypothetical protein
MRQQIHRTSGRALRVRYKVGFDIRQPLRGWKAFDTVRSCNLKKMHLVLQRLFCCGPQVWVNRQAHCHKTPSRVRDVAPIFLYDKVRCATENNKPEGKFTRLELEIPSDDRLHLLLRCIAVKWSITCVFGSIRSGCQLDKHNIPASRKYVITPIAQTSTGLPCPTGRHVGKPWNQ